MAHFTTGPGGILKKIAETGTILVCLACLFTPLSTSLMGVFSGLAVLAWVISGDFLSLPRILRSYPATMFAFLLFVLMCIAVFYTPVDLPEAFNTLKKYRELILLPIIISLLCKSKRHRELAENCFIAGCIVLMAISFGMAGDIIPEDRYGHSIVFHITHSFFMAVLAFWAINRTIDSGKYRYYWLFVFLAATVNLFYIAPGRTGMFIFVCLMFLFLVQRFSLTKCFLGLFILGLLLSIMYITSDNFSDRIHRVSNEIVRYEMGKSRTSIGQRFDWWLSCMTLISEKPVLGHGTGSFRAVHERVTKNNNSTGTDNPHNEYLFITTQFGFVGLVLFLGLFLFQFLGSRTLPDQKRFLLQGVILAMLSGSLMNSLLFDSQQGHFYLFMSAVLMAAQPKYSMREESPSQ